MGTTVGFIGLGHMGKPMATNVVSAGFRLVVHDLREEPCRELSALGAETSSSANVAAVADIIEVMVMNDNQVRQVLGGEDGVFSHARPGSIVAIHSTISLDTVNEMGEMALAHGVAVVDAPVNRLGGGRFSILVGGSRDAAARCRPVFAAAAGSEENVIYLGDLGAGTIAKLSHNLVHHMNALAASEGIRLAHAAGLDMEGFGEVLRQGSAQSKVAERWGVRHGFWGTRPENDRPPQHARKDLDLALRLGRELHLLLPGAELTRELSDTIR